MKDDSMEDRLPSPKLLAEEADDVTIRPAHFEEFVGQAQIKDTLVIAIAAAKRPKESLDHIQFSGPPSLGKTNLAQIVG